MPVWLIPVPPQPAQCCCKILPYLPLCGVWELQGADASSCGPMCELRDRMEAPGAVVAAAGVSGSCCFPSMALILMSSQDKGRKRGQMLITSKWFPVSLLISIQKTWRERWGNLRVYITYPTHTQSLEKWWSPICSFLLLFVWRGRCFADRSPSPCLEAQIILGWDTQ